MGINVSIKAAKDALPRRGRSCAVTTTPGIHQIEFNH